MSIKFRYAGICLFWFTCVVFADKPQFQFSLQSWASFTTYETPGDSINPAATSAQTGFGIRRARLRGKAVSGDAAAFIQYEAVSSAMLDVRLDYQLSPGLTLRMGRFIGPGSQAGGRTGHTSIDFIERSIVGRNWGAAVARSDYHTYGLSLIEKSGRFSYEIMASNGAGDVNLKPYNSKSGGSTTATGYLPQLDFMASMAVGDAIAVGAHYGLANPDRVDKSSATGFVYFRPADYGTGAVRSKLDWAYIGDNSIKTDLAGVSLLGAYRLTDNLEMGGRVAYWDPNLDGVDDALTNYTIGINFSPDPDHWMDTLFKFDLTVKTTTDPAGIPDPLVAHILWQMYLH